VLEVEDLLLKGGRDHHLVRAVGGRAAAEVLIWIQRLLRTSHTGLVA